MNCQDDIFLHSTINLNFQQGVKQWHFYNRLNTLLPPANVVCESYVFTGVCLSTGGGSPSKETPWKEEPPGRETPQQVDPPGRETPQKEAFLAGRPPTPHSGRRHPLAGRFPGRKTNPRQRDPPPTATAAGGTHPTGMHSCLFYSILFSNWDQISLHT